MKNNWSFDQLRQATRADLIKQYEKELKHFGYDTKKQIFVKLVSYEKNHQINFFVQFNDPDFNLPSIRINF